MGREAAGFRRSRREPEDDLDRAGPLRRQAHQLALRIAHLPPAVARALDDALPTPEHGAAEFPYRDLIIVTAFGVVLGTLVLQGLTLGR